MSGAMGRQQSSGRVTVVEVAAAAGFSFATAAAALRGERWVKESTRERILEVAKGLGYRRSEAASLLASRRHRRETPRQEIAVGWLTGLAVLGAGMRERLKRARRAAEGRGWFFHHANVGSRDDLERALRRWEAVGVEGIVVGRFTDPRLLGTVSWSSFSVLSSEIDNLERGFDVVRPSHFRAVIDLLALVRERGYERIGIWLREHDAFARDDDTRQGACAAFQARHLPARLRLPILRTPIRIQRTSGLQRAIRYLERERPDALVSLQSVDRGALSERVPEAELPPGFAALHVRESDVGGIAGILDREQCMPDAVYRAVEQRLRMGARGLSQHPQEIVFHTPFVDGGSLPDRSRVASGGPG